MVSDGFYSYLWLREHDGTFSAGTPYYVGKGRGDRAYSSFHRIHPPKDRSCILIFPQLSEADAFESEIALIELFGRVDNGTGCLRNLTDGGEGSAGCIRSFEYLEKQREAHKGQQPTPECRAKINATRQTLEYRANMSAKLRGRVFSPEARANMSEGQKGRILSIEHRAKISAANQGRRPSLETLEKMSAAQKGHSVSLETRVKISKANKNPSEETRYRMREARKSRLSVSEETRHKMSEAHKNPSEETRRKMSEAQRYRWARKRASVPL